MYKMIRAGTGYGVVIIVTPADATPNTPGVQCFERKNWKVGDNPVDTFYEISTLSAQLGFSGHADAWGYAELPKESFESIEKVDEWIKEQREIFFAQNPDFRM